MDRDLAPEIRRRRIARRIVTAVIATAAILFSFAATIEWLRPSVRLRDIQTARVERGDVDSTLQASGTIVPAVEQIISSPIETRVLRIVREAGDRVRAGDELVALDTSQTRLDLDRLSGQLAQKESEQAQLRLKNEDTLASLQAQIEQKKLDREILRYKAEQSAKLLKGGLVSEQDDLAAVTAAKKADIEQTQLREALVRAERTGDAELAAAAAELSTLHEERRQAQDQLQLAMMRADRGGIITSIVSDSGAIVHKGDVVARIADLSSFRVDGTISDVHAAQLAPGMPLRVRLDDAIQINGAVASIEPRIEGGIVKFHAGIEPNAKLRNNVRVDVYVVTGRRQNVLRVKRGALGQGEFEDVFVVRGRNLERVSVHWGLAGERFIEPLGGLREGDEVAISNMADYAGVKQLRLK